MSESQATRELLDGHITAIRTELRSLGWWSDRPPTPDQMAFEAAFGADRLTFAQWIQFVLLERLADVAAGNGSLPPQSHLAAKAVREYDGVDEASGLIDRLQALDEFVNRR